MIRWIVRVGVALIILATPGGSLPALAQADSVNVDYVGWHLASNWTDVDKVELSFDANLIGEYEVTVELLDNGKNVVSSGSRLFTNPNEEDKLVIDLIDAPIEVVYYIRVTVEKWPEMAPTSGGPGYYSVHTDYCGVTGLFEIDRNGRVIRTITASCQGGLLTITIEKDTIALDKNGEPLTTLTILEDGNPPAPPEGTNIITIPYAIGPAGATFNPPLTFTWTYDPEELPEGVAEEDLVLSYYDGEKWVYFDCEVDTDAKTITASVSHFTTFAALAFIPEVEAAARAVFALSSLSISPAEINIDETVNISLLVTNTGGTSGSYTVTLNINGVKEADKTVTVAAGGSQAVTFSFTAKATGSYSVNVDGLSGSFTVPAEPGRIAEVVEPEEVEDLIPAKPFNWLWVVVGVAFMLLVVILGIRYKRKK